MINGVRYTTITTDAGIRDGVAAYAYYIRSNEHIVSNSAQFLVPISNISEAEIGAVLYALNRLTKSHYLLTADSIVINCDNKFAIGVLKSKRFKGIYKRFEKVYENILSKINCPITFKHVESHVAKTKRQPRHHVNEWCDKQVRKHYK